MNRFMILFIMLFFMIAGNGIAAEKPEAAKNNAKESKKNAEAKKPQDWRKSLPRIGYVYPAGGQQGTTVEIIVGGQQLYGTANNVSISGQGIKILSVTPIVSVNRYFYQYFRADFTKELSKRYNFPVPEIPKRGKNVKDKELDEKAWEKIKNHVLFKDFDKMTHRYLELMARNVFVPPNALQISPAINAELVIKLQIDKDAASGTRELRVWDDRRGLSNPLHFYVSELPEITEERLFGPTQKMKTKVELPAIINGQVMPGEIDSFLFKAKKGQALVFAVMARRIIPYLGDAVPGWFQPVISIHDEKGRELKFEDDFNCSPDPLMLFKVPADGEYELQIRDSIYRGRKDFVYRIKAGEFPFVTNIFPLGAKAGKTTKIHLNGYNLTDKELDATIPADQTDSYRLEGISDSAFNPVYLAVDSLTEVFEEEDNNAKDKAQNITLGSIINGRINRPGDVDIFKISGKAGEKVVFELNARSLGSPLDALMLLCDNKGRQMFVTDDTKQVNIGLNTHQADPYQMFTLPENGEYYLSLRDVQNHGGNDFSYRLRISQPRPDFRIYAGVASLNIRRWQTTIQEPVRIVRKDGFDGPIVIKDNSEKPVFNIVSDKIKGDEGNITFQLIDGNPGKSEPPFPVQFVGQAEINKRIVTRKLVPCENMMQAFIYYHWMPYAQLMAYPNRR